ncbi:DUF1684 domain-containing protein [Nocardioides taihuensis]|uniref:DUF1684 domain-containing protein n=1 Tax=Nocardioides taihuensis TaxID=1835606 RepID=A0ABW0BGW1_9ACTN
MTDFLGDWQAWRDARERRLSSPDGWLAITAIHWLTAAPERFDDVPGAWSAEGGKITVTLAVGETLSLDGDDLAEGEHVLGRVDEDGVTVAFGDAIAEVADRDGATIVRPRHPDSPLLRAYRGTPCYPPDPRWVLPARFAPYAEPDGSLWILFRDATSGITTYPANRQLVAPAPSPDGATELDFNRAFNMPCAYTDFATCPVAPPQNTLPFAVEAGEQDPASAGRGAARGA